MLFLWLRNSTMTRLVLESNIFGLVRFVGVAAAASMQFFSHCCCCRDPFPYASHDGCCCVFVIVIDGIFFFCYRWCCCWRPVSSLDLSQWLFYLFHPSFKAIWVSNPSATMVITRLVNSRLSFLVLEARQENWQQLQQQPTNALRQPRSLKL